MKPIIMGLLLFIILLGGIAKAEELTVEEKRESIFKRYLEATKTCAGIRINSYPLSPHIGSQEMGITRGHLLLDLYKARGCDRTKP